MPGSPRPHLHGLVSAPVPHLLHSLVVPLASLAIAAAAYLLGSIPTGYLLVRIFRRQDIRSVGSGNIGATNVVRVGGKGLGAATFLLDVLKGAAAVWLGGLLGALLMPTVPLRAAQAIAALLSLGTSSLFGFASAAAKPFPPASASSWPLRPGPRWPHSVSLPSYSPSAASFPSRRFSAQPAFPSSRGFW